MWYAEHGQTWSAVKYAKVLVVKDGIGPNRREFAACLDYVSCFLIAYEI